MQKSTDTHRPTSPHRSQNGRELVGGAGRKGTSHRPAPCVEQERVKLPWTELGPPGPRKLRNLQQNHEVKGEPATVVATVVATHSYVSL